MKSIALLTLVALPLAAASSLRKGQPALAAGEASTCALFQSFISASAKNAAAGAHECPVKIGKHAEYFKKLHTSLVKGSGPLQGCIDESSQEYYVNFFEKELECIFATMVKDKCGSIESKFGKRQVPWEGMCLNGEKDLLDAYNLMDGDEKKYFNKVKLAAKERQIYATYMALAGDKEMVCMFMKAVDDDCAKGMAFSKPRMKPESFWKKAMKGKK